jgi:pyruvate dehydrogenase E2 component (dihydrolipoamide acetyltransferase)
MARAFTLPDLGEGIHEAEIQEVLVKEGARVEEGDAILVVETDKAMVEVPLPYAGIIAKIHVAAGAVVQVGDVLITFDGTEAAAGAPAREAASREAEMPTEEKPAKEKPVPAAASAAAEGPATPISASPATRRLARELAVDLRWVSPSGPAGQVTAEDVRAFAEQQGKAAEAGPPKKARPTQPALSPAEAQPDVSRWGGIERVPLRSVRRAIAKKMAESWSRIPHVSHYDLADITTLEHVRRDLAAEVGDGTLALTVFVMKAAVTALTTCPRFNASVDVEAEEIILKQYCHLNIAVDTERGLIVPVIRDVDRKSFAELAAELPDIAQRACDGEIQLEEMQGDTFTITNIGSLGGRSFTPLINDPQAAILGMGRASWQPVVRGHDDTPDAMTIVPRYLLPLILAFDHRLLDGADAARFLGLVIHLLENPTSLMLRV